MSAEASGMQAAPAADDSAVRALYQQMLDGWNQASSEAYAAPFTADGEVTWYDGSQMAGQAEVIAQMQPIFAHPPMAAYVAKVRGVRLLSADVAVLRAIAGMVPLGQSDIAPKVNALHTIVAVRGEGTWSTALFQTTAAQFHGRPELVKAMTEELRELL